MADKAGLKAEQAFYSNPSNLADGFLSQYCHEHGVYRLRYWRGDYRLWDRSHYERVGDFRKK